MFYYFRLIFILVKFYTVSKRKLIVSRAIIVTGDRGPRIVNIEQKMEDKIVRREDCGRYHINKHNYI